MLYKSLIPVFLIAFTILAACSGGDSDENSPTVANPTNITTLGSQTAVPKSTDPAIEPEPTTANETIDEGNPTAISTTITSESPQSTVEELGPCAVLGLFDDRTSCTRLAVSCENVPPINAEVRITLPQPDVPYLGTVVLGSGGNGHGFLASESPNEETQALHIVQELANAGYKVMERKWIDGWFGDGAEAFGLVEPSCRYVEILKWIESKNETPGALCAYGNSGGSAEIAYSLTHWNTETMFDTVVLGGGPPMAQLSPACLGFGSYPEWEQVCKEIWNETQTECGEKTPVCTFTDKEVNVERNLIDSAFIIADLNGLCTGSSTTFAAMFDENSVLAPNADVEYPNTPVHFVIGRRDCTIAATQGPLYYDAITSEKSIEFLEGVEHDVFSSQAGADAVINALKESCVAR